MKFPATTSVLLIIAIGLFVPYAFVREWVGYLGAFTGTSVFLFVALPVLVTVFLVELFRRRR
jgi:hypothetical protein